MLSDLWDALKFYLGNEPIYTSPRPEVVKMETNNTDIPVEIDNAENDKYSVFCKDDILPDSLFGYDYNFKTKDFLEQKKSALLRVVTADGEKLGDKLVELISLASMKYDVNEKLLLVSLQREQSLITGYNKALRIPQRVLDRALGFGCTDGGDMPEYYGFESQVNNCARIYRKWYDYGKDKLKKKFVVDDGKNTVFPATQFTYTLYKYCPHIGDKNSPRFKDNGGMYGNYATWNIWKVYFPTDLA